MEVDNVKFGQLSARASRRVIALTLALACIVVPAAVFAIADAGGGAGGDAVAAAVPANGVTTVATPAFSAGWVSQAVTVEMSATPGQVVAYKRWNDGDSEPATFSYGTVNTTETVTLSFEGTQTLVWGAAADDKALPSVTETRTVKIDKTRPGNVAFKVTPNLGASVWATATVSVEMSATDGLSGVQAIKYQVRKDNVLGSEESTGNGRSLLVSADGTYTIVAYAMDSAGNTSTALAESSAFKVDTHAPVSTAAGSTIASSAVDFAAWQSKDVTLTLAAADPVGGSGLETTPTVYRVTQPSGYSGGIVTSYTVPFKLSNEGTTTVEFWTKDRAGNVEATKSRLVLIDKSKPSSRASYKSSYNGRATISIDASDALSPESKPLSGVSKVYYKLDNLAPAAGASITTTATGAHTLTFWCEDRAGNVETTTSANTVSFTVNPDPGAPVTTVSATSGGAPIDLTKWQSADVTVTLNATDTPAGVGVANTWYRLGSVITTYTVPFKLSTEGTTTVEYWSVDELGNKEATKTATVRIDRTKPVSSCEATAAYLDNATVSISATDTPSGVAAIYAWLEGGTQRWNAYGADGVAALTTKVEYSAAGTHTVEYIVTDFAGNREATRTVTFHVSRKPSLVLSTRSATLKNSASPAKSVVSGTLYDGSVKLGAKRVTLEYSNSSTFSAKKSVSATTTASGKFSFNVSLADKTYYRVKFAGDADYRATSSSTISLTPRVYISTPKGGTSQRAYRTFYLTGTLKPAHSAAYKLYVKRYKWSTSKRKYYYDGITRATITARSGYSSYKAAMKVKKGTWRFYGYMPSDSKHASTTTPYSLKVTVR